MYYWCRWILGVTAPAPRSGRRGIVRTDAAQATIGRVPSVGSIESIDITIDRTTNIRFTALNITIN